MKQASKSPAVFIVDDDPDDRQIIHDAFGENNFSNDLTLIENGQQLIDNLLESESRKLPSLILLDLNMPGKDGREVIKELKGNINFRHIPVIIFTTSSFDKDRETCYDLGANCFVTKPSSYNKMVETIQSISKLWLAEKLS